jgi:hypothetical protein
MQEQGTTAQHYRGYRRLLPRGRGNRWAGNRVWPRASAGLSCGNSSDGTDGVHVKIQWLRVGCLSMCTVAVDSTAIKSLPGRGCSMGMYVKYCNVNVMHLPVYTHTFKHNYIYTHCDSYPRKQVGTTANTNTNRTTRREPGTENKDRPRTGREHRGGREGMSDE